MPGDSVPEAGPRGDRSRVSGEDYSGPYRVRRAVGTEAVPHGRRPGQRSHLLCTVPDVRDVLLDDLDARQHDAVTSGAAPLAIIAPAGSGKTRVLTRRIAYGAREGRLNPKHVLAVTFTRKAAGELVSRIGRLGVDRRITAGTFHAIALAQLRRHAAERNREPPRVLEHKARLIGPILGARGPSASVAIADIGSEIEWAKARLIGPDHYVAAAEAAGRRPARAAGDVSRVYAAYESEKRKRHLIDFDDVLGRCAEAVAHDEEFAAGQRWRFRHLFVDEFQDATPLQLRLLRAWLGTTHDLTVVGDPAQAIYGFTGADATPLIAFERTFPGGTTIVLDRNYRSTPAVVALAEVALGNAAGDRRSQPEAIRPDGAPPTITGFDDDAAEARAIADACWHAHADGVPWNRIAVLFRTNAHSSRFEAALTKRGVPFRIGEGQRFTARAPVRLLLDDLRELERTRPGLPFGQYLADLAADNPDPEQRKPEQRKPETGSDVDASGANVGPRERDAMVTTDGDATDPSERDALLELGRDYLDSVSGSGAVSEFTAWLDTAAGASTGAHGVDLVTFHRAKGLEWALVFVTGVERGMVPISWATTPESQAEERRLLHVAFSRAEEELHVSWARARLVGTRRAPREPSPWLGPLENEANRAPHGLLTRRRAPRDHLGELRATLAAASPPTPPPDRRGRLRH
ncbi:MAG: ATP-dependent helicase UvrD/PcrA [Actinomycetota bacterium]|nr:ATP-dependent helicase UvrD/PcrA [Actinomycetota bacterium]